MFARRLAGEEVNRDNSEGHRVGREDGGGWALGVLKVAEEEQSFC